MTCDTAPPYFDLNENAIGDYRTYAKLSPPLRREDDRLAVLAGLADGTIDAIASDHQPRDADDKRLPFAQASAGGVGLATLLAVTLAHVHNGELTLERGDRVADQPAGCADGRRGRTDRKGAAAIFACSIRTGSGRCRRGRCRAKRRIHRSTVVRWRERSWEPGRPVTGLRRGFMKYTAVPPRDGITGGTGHPLDSTAPNQETPPYRRHRGKKRRPPGACHRDRSPRAAADDPGDERWGDKRLPRRKLHPVLTVGRGGRRGGRRAVDQLVVEAAPSWPLQAASMVVARIRATPVATRSFGNAWDMIRTPDGWVSSSEPKNLFNRQRNSVVSADTSGRNEIRAAK